MTLKEINLSPGPGDYHRLNEQFPRTFHFTSKHGPTTVPVFSASGKSDLPSYNPLLVSAEAAEEAQGSDLYNMVFDSQHYNRKPKTAQHFFGVATGA